MDGSLCMLIDSFFFNLLTFLIMFARNIFFDFNIYFLRIRGKGDMVSLFIYVNY